jgi:signal transduction histidine kinase
MPGLRRLLPKTITAQITTLVAAAVLAGVLLTFVVLASLMGNRKARMNPQLKAASEAARIATVVKEAKSTESPAELAEIISRAQSPGGSVEVETRLTTNLRVKPSQGSGHNEFAKRISDSLKSDWGIEPLENATVPDRTDAIFVRLGSDSVLVFQISEYQVAQTFLLVQAGVALSIILVAMLVISVYAIRWVTRPLSEVAEAARSFGRSSNGDRILKLDGPREIAQVAQALNEMRKRVRSLVDERTRMLAAISHDLRTPLTRLRLRSERVIDVAERGNMLNDIATIDAMIGETLAYLRDGGSAEAVMLVDLPSLIQTICGQFNDVGHEVQYSGPDRFAFACRAHALTRAVTNVIENAIKHGSSVAVRLKASVSTDAHVEISDDGPGISPDLMEKVFEPFFKADDARSPSGARGFGLGLSIAREIVERHGGSITLANIVPTGLTVRILLKRDQEAGSRGLAGTKKISDSGGLHIIHGPSH